MFRESGEAVLIDFGLSRHDRLPDLLAEEFRLPMGTGPYISPEQVRHIRNDPRSDLFALGVVLYYLATGARPFGNPTSLHGLRRGLYRDPIPPRARADDPPWLQGDHPALPAGGSRDRYDTAAQWASSCTRAGPPGARAPDVRRRVRGRGETAVATLARSRTTAVGRRPALPGLPSSSWRWISPGSRRRWRTCFAWRPNASCTRNRARGWPA
jgi:serine/threonine protein kinase